MSEKIDTKELFELALKASENSYSPYSHFPVGAALLCENGKVFTGCNVENRSFGATRCAEQTAILKAVSQGEKNFKMIAIATPESDYPVGPCGVCRQIISEFAPEKAIVIFGPSWENHIESTIGELYPSDSLHELAK